MSDREFKLQVLKSLNNKIDLLKEHLIDCLDTFLTLRCPDYIVNKCSSQIVEEVMGQELKKHLLSQLAELIVENEKLKHAE